MILSRGYMDPSLRTSLFILISLSPLRLFFLSSLLFRPASTHPPTAEWSSWQVFSTIIHQLFYPNIRGSEIN